jgi:hypothetical protein
MFNWENETLTMLNLALTFVVAALIVKDVRLLTRRAHRRVFQTGVGVGRMAHSS